MPNVSISFFDAENDPAFAWVSDVAKLFFLSPESAAIYMVLIHCPAATAEEIQKRMEGMPILVDWHLDELVDKSLAVKQDGRYTLALGDDGGSNFMLPRPTSRKKRPELKSSRDALLALARELRELEREAPPESEWKPIKRYMKLVREANRRAYRLARRNIVVLDAQLSWDRTRLYHEVTR